MIKKYLIVMTSLLLLLLLAGCTDHAIPSIKSTEGTTIEETSFIEAAYETAHQEPTSVILDWEKQLQITLNRANNALPYDQLITKQYPEKQVLGGFSTFHARTEPTSIISVDQRNPIECLRKMNDGAYYYALYITAEGGWYYLFFPQEANYALTHTVYVRNPVDASAYAQLKPGDRLIDILYADAPAPCALIPCKETEIILNSITIDDSFCTYVLLKDRLILLRFKQDSDRLYLVLDSIQSFMDKKLVIDANVKTLQELPRTQQIEQVFDFNILPQDYPQ